jgi:hypothetical protein
MSRKQDRPGHPSLGPNRSDAALDTAFSNPTPVNAIALTAKGVIDQLAVDTGRLAVSSNGAGTYFASGSILKPVAQTGIGKLGGGILGAVSAAKGVFDIALYFDALVACSQDPTLQ